MRGRLLDNILCIVLLLLCAPALLRAIHPGYYKITSFQVSEWLINYEGGFVRRGLPGEVLFALAKEGLNPYLLIIGVSLVIWLLLFLMLLRLASVRGFPALAICSQLCMLSPV